MKSKREKRKEELANVFKITVKKLKLFKNAVANRKHVN